MQNNYSKVVESKSKCVLPRVIQNGLAYSGTTSLDRILKNLQNESLAKNKKQLSSRYFVNSNFITNLKIFSKV